MKIVKDLVYRDIKFVVEIGNETNRPGICSPFYHVTVIRVHNHPIVSTMPVLLPDNITEEDIEQDDQELLDAIYRALDIYITLKNV